MSTLPHDGLYRVDVPQGTRGARICAGFVIERGKLVQCAPILRRRFREWLAYAKRIGP